MSTPHPGPGRPRGSPRPQRAHRTPVVPPRPGARSARLSTRHLAGLAARLTPRDLWLLAMLHEHRVLTTHAIARIAFTSDHRARRRLLQLHRWDVLERFAPRLPVGAAPHHHVLGPAGAAVLAAHHGLPLAALRYRRDDAVAIAHHHTLAHTVAVNDLFAHLIHHTLTSPDPREARRGRPFRLEAWWSEGRCRRHLDYVRPDAYGRLTTTPAAPGARPPVLEWFLELDFATSTLEVLARKLDRYAQLAATTRPRPLLIWLPTPAREAHARDRLIRALQALGPDLVPIATTTAAIAALPRPTRIDAAGDGDGAGGDQRGPADRVWLPLTGRRGAERIDLTDLAHRWPAAPGHTLHDETDNDAQADTEVDMEADADAGYPVLPAPSPLPPDPRSFATTARRQRRE
jgi:hypothetical protein